MAETEIKAPNAFVQWVRAAVAAIQRLKPTRVFMHYTARRGPILAAGLSYQGIFSVFGAVLAGFSVAGLVLAGSPELRDGLIDVVSTGVTAAPSIPTICSRATCCVPLVCWPSSHR
jgi:uncharacterized BrkB/YihY/UPF0761 family membrane protein